MTRRKTMSFNFDRMRDIAPFLSNWWQSGSQARPCILHSYPSDFAGTTDEPDSLETWWTKPDYRASHACEVVNGTEFSGEAVPSHYIDFGSSAMAAVLGARMEFVDRETVWAYPAFSSLEDIVEISLDAANEYYAYLKSLTKRSAARAHAHHYVTHFALGAPGDTLAALYGTEPLLMDMIERPDVVELAMDQIKRIWIQCFEEFRAYIDASDNDGYVGWAGVWAPGTTFPMQEDFSYMISPEMYRRFCLPHVAEMVDSLEYPMYHLDGIGAIPHLDALLDLEHLRVIQWVPGAGHEDLDQWYALIERILKHGKSVQLFARTEEIEPLIDRVGTNGVLVTVSDPSPENAQLLADRFGI